MPRESRQTRFGLLRHAPTLWNREKRIQGLQDSLLTPEGEALCKIWRQTLAKSSWHRILSSDLGRALKTAEMINRRLNVPLAQTHLLREMDWGRWTGKSIRQIDAENPGLISVMEKSGWQFCPPGGENRKAVWERSCRALTEAAAKWSGETILVVTHEGVIKSLVYRLLQRRFLPGERPVLKQGYLHALIHDSGGLKIERINALVLK